MKHHALLFSLALALAAAPASAAPGAPADVTAAVAAPGRTADNVKLDEQRKPVDVLTFFGLKRGSHVLDMFGANQYWSEIMARAVGPTGKVVVWQPTQFLKDDRRTGFADFAKRQKNVSLITSPFEDPELGTNAYDFMIMNLDYHDVY
ncbi:MAG: methyltransferase, partial [Sphingomicrobium sp.]